MTPLSGTHLGLLRRGSPLLDDGLRGPGDVLWQSGEDRFAVFYRGTGFAPDVPGILLLLDLTDLTGAFHARLWAGTDPERLKAIREAGVETGTPAVPVVYQTKGGKE